MHLQLTLVSLDALGSTEAFSRADMAQIGMAVTLAGCKAKTKNKKQHMSLVEILKLKLTIFESPLFFFKST